MQKYYAPAIPASPQLQPAQNFALMLLASYSHMAKNGEITSKQEAELCGNVLREVKNIPGVSAGHKR